MNQPKTWWKRDWDQNLPKFSWHFLLNQPKTWWKRDWDLESKLVSTPAVKIKNQPKTWWKRDWDRTGVFNIYLHFSQNQPKTWWKRDWDSRKCSSFVFPSTKWTNLRPDEKGIETNGADPFRCLQKAVNQPKTWWKRDWDTIITIAEDDVV